VSTPSKKVDRQSRLKLAPSVVLRHDQMRKRKVLLAPERMFVPNETTLMIVEELDGTRSVEDLCQHFSGQYDIEPETLRCDVIDLLQDMVDRQLLIFMD